MFRSNYAAIRHAIVFSSGALPVRVYLAKEEPEQHSRAMTSLSMAYDLELCQA